MPAFFRLDFVLEIEKERLLNYDIKLLVVSNLTVAKIEKLFILVRFKLKIFFIIQPVYILKAVPEILYHLKYFYLIVL